MIDESRARELANAAFVAGEVVLGAARELEQGWHFPGITKDIHAFDGVIVNKKSGEVTRVLNQGALSRDPSLYDRGYQFLLYDLVVFEVQDVEVAVRLLCDAHERVEDVYYKYGKVWRVGRGLTEDEVRERISTLPAVFSRVGLDYIADRLEAAREAGAIDFKLFEYQVKG